MEEPKNETLETPKPNQEWESTAREWLLSLPENTPLTVTDVETWFNNNNSCLPENMTIQELHNHLNSIQLNNFTAPEPSAPPPPPEVRDPHIDFEHPYRFQRSDVWKPVYTWLESFDDDNLIKSQDILDWLTENSEIREQLYVKHSRYHVMHYIKKCHIKILKRREKKKGVQLTNIPKPVRPPKTEAINRPAPIPYYLAGNASNNLSKDSDLYASKRSEALQKYEILLELEKQLAVAFQKPQTVD